jgi:FkbM family methyltransferase
MTLKRIFKHVLGRALVSIAELLPRTRGLLRPLGLRTSQDLFGNRIVSVQLPNAKSLRLTHVDESYLAFQLFWRGSQYYEPITRSLLASLLHPGDTFLDIGAHLGFFALTAGLSNPGVLVIAFEPNPKNFRILKANALANGLNGLICEPMAISDRDGTGTLYLTESDMSASLMKDFQAEDTRQIGSVEVRTASLDTYLEQQSIQGRLTIKVDIEGHEPAFFRGAARTIAACKPDIILEVLYEQESELVSQLKSIGYHFYPITDEGLVELEAPRLIKRFPFLFLNHLLSARPRREIAELFERVCEATRNLSLLQTSKHFPKEQWPSLWPAEPSQASNKAANQG